MLSPCSGAELQYNEKMKVPENIKIGHLHPISLMVADISRIMTNLGFDVVDGPELESEYYNFDALNVPKDHPSRDMQDTFWLKPRAPTRGSEERKLPRTHTSGVWVRYMKEKMKNGVLPPYAMISPGKVFRNEATDATHEAQFFQVDGMMLGKDVTLGHLKGTLNALYSGIFGQDVQIRFRTSFFPFTEPSVEIDMACFKCGGKGLNPPDGGSLDPARRGLGCTTCKKAGFIEVMGAGMIHPKVLLECGVDSREYQGFAFGGGIDRLAMLKWGIEDVRFLYNGDLRVVNQF